MNTQPHLQTQEVSEILVGLYDSVGLCDSVVPQVIIWENGSSVAGGGGLRKKEERQEAALNKYLTGNALGGFQKHTLRILTLYSQKNP